MKVTVIYGTDNGNTQNAAIQIASQLGGKVFDITLVAISDFEDCDLLILGTPTYGFGDLQGGLGCASQSSQRGKPFGKEGSPVRPRRSGIL